MYFNKIKNIYFQSQSTQKISKTQIKAHHAVFSFKYIYLYSGHESCVCVCVCMGEGGRNPEGQGYNEFLHQFFFLSFKIVQGKRDYVYAPVLVKSGSCPAYIVSSRQFIIGNLFRQGHSLMFGCSRITKTLITYHMNILANQAIFGSFRQT